MMLVLHWADPGLLVCRIPGQPPLDDPYRSVCFRVFLKTLQSPKPPDTDDLFYCLVVQAALKGLQCCLSGGKWKFGGEELGSTLAALKVENRATLLNSSLFLCIYLKCGSCVPQRLMFQGAPGLNVDWPSVLYPALLSQYEGVSAEKSAEPQKSAEMPKGADTTGKASGVCLSLIFIGLAFYVFYLFIYLFICHFVMVFLLFLLRKRRGNQKEKVRRRRLMRAERMTGRRKIKRQCLYIREEEKMELEMTGRRCSNLLPRFSTRHGS